MSRNLSTNALTTPSPTLASRGRQLRLGWTMSLPITAGDQGDPTGGETTAPPPPSVGVDDGFMLASSARGHRTTPTDRAMVVEGTPLQQNNRFMHGTPSASEDKKDSPILLTEPEPSVATASMSTMAATVETALAEIAESNRQMVALERQHNQDYDSNMASLGRRHSRVEQMFLDVSEHIGMVRAESSSLVVMNRDIRTVVSNSMATFLRTLEINDQKYRDVWVDTD